MRRAIVKRLAIAAAVVVVLAFAGCTRMPFEGTASSAPRCELWRGIDCRVVGGRIVYVQRDDPDGDGDVHVVLASRGSVTWPGVSVVKLSASLRNTPGLGVGRWLVASGHTYAGSHGEDIVGAVEVATYSRW
jgi:hypothetical protein